ncbi:hypothetical protein CTAYLR_005741 [Chrysophaeum taylorii]|uniref:Uncharacterized protein n=1 Tax=Chrysophaeum taylorii TaxID=2483200 RepID=A0AAD7UKQ8_9STRA|nr:hypothetical protein CTAYLR_005741 [Chrysophaeum taylorii]
MMMLAFLLLPAAYGFVTTPNGGQALTVRAAEMSKALPFLTKPKLLDGTMAGDVGFDPLGLSEIDDVGIDLYWMREAEIKHGRVAMLATAGILFVEIFGPLPGWPLAEGRSQMDVFWDAWDEHPNAITSAFLVIGIVEIIMGVAITQGRETGKRAPGDWGFNPIGFKVTEDMAMKEIANGRLAMWAAAGMILQGVITHKPCLENIPL